MRSPSDAATGLITVISGLSPATPTQGACNG